MSAPALSMFLTEWPALEPWFEQRPCALPVLRWLPQALEHSPDFSTPLLAALGRCAPLMAWKQTYTALQVNAEFLDNYGWSALIGPGGPLNSDRIACGFLLLGPDTHYPRHRHPAEEIYVLLSGTAAWQQGEQGWQQRAAGSLIEHHSEQPHSMRTGPAPMLAMYLWRGSGLRTDSRLDL
jgi:Dimethlysulfonioproprionate lyase